MNSGTKEALVLTLGGGVLIGLFLSAFVFGIFSRDKEQITHVTLDKVCSNMQYNSKFADYKDGQIICSSNAGRNGWGNDAVVYNPDYVKDK